jgi:L-aspartate oxidase
MPISCETLVLGSGVAGLSFALEAAAYGDVVLVTKRSRDESNTKYAQGGIAAVLAAGDSFESHTRDTIAAGAGLCHERVVEMCVKEGPERIGMLRAIGARFDEREEGDRKDGDVDLDLHLEAAHSARRIVHSKDMTGREVERALLEAVAAQPRIRLLEEHIAIDLITLAKYGGPELCAGAYVLDVGAGRVETILARATVLATGGRGRSTSIRRTRTSRPGTASPSRTAPGRRWRTWSSTSSTPPASSSRRPRTSSSRRRSGGRGRSSGASTAPPS